ncbi:MAG TPA: serine/threonine protein phosphatase [Rhodobacteraceae bacterium]|nr:serine/threonine protein phosphatase [Paracoccaceae bacterium]
MRAYAIGDIHGQLEKLRHAHVLIEADRAECEDDEAPVVHIGDLTDRGPDTGGVLAFLIDGQAGGEPWVVLKGNHDRMFSLFLRQPARRDPLLRAELDYLHPRIGGLETLASYGVDISAGRSHGALHRDARAMVPAAHRAFLENLPTAHRLGPLFFCHAGIRPGVALERQLEDDLLWIRQEFYASDADHGALIVHGHTPLEQVTHFGNRVNIDTGAGYGNALSAVVFEGRDVWRLTDRGRVRVQRILGRSPLS